MHNGKPIRLFWIFIKNRTVIRIFSSIQCQALGIGFYIYGAALRRHCEIIYHSSSFEGAAVSAETGRVEHLAAIQFSRPPTASARPFGN
jgi:hypothetical protein